MKTQFYMLTIFILMSAFPALSQPQWKFHVAFEDATGAKDTIWFIWDTTATVYGIDTALGEGNPNMDYSKFNVWTLTWNTYPDFDTTKVVAYPYEASFASEIQAINFELPITVSWDSSLFHADWLPPLPVGYVNHARIYNDYFFLYPNGDLIHHFDMTLDDSITEPNPGNSDPWVWEDWVHFPMSIVLMQDPEVGVPQHQLKNPNLLRAYPNPFANETTFEINLDKESLADIYIYNIKGQLVKTILNKRLEKGTNHIKWSRLTNASRACKPGSYIAYLKVNGTFKQSIKLIIH